MTKPYDTQALIEKARKYGGPDAEKLIKANWMALKEWFAESAELTKTPIDNVIAAGMQMGDGPIMAVLDQVDGIKGN